MPIRGNFVEEEDVCYGNSLDTGYNVVLRRGCYVGHNVRIWSNTVIDAGAFVGSDVRIHCNCYIAQRSHIERDVFIGPGTQILNDKYPVRTDPSTWKPVVVRQGAIIGGGCTILPGIEIGKEAVIGAGSVVTKNVPPNEVWAGCPACKLMDRHEYELRQGLTVLGTDPKNGE